MAQDKQTTPTRSALQRRLDEMHDHSADASPAAATSPLVGFGGSGSPFTQKTPAPTTSTNK